MNQILLHTPDGVRDIYGKECARKLEIEKKIREKLLSFGYEDIETPTFEYFDVFSNEIGTIPSRDLYKFFDKEGDTLVLRPDFTPSIARCAAKYFMEDNVPLRFCYCGNTFINTTRLQGKLREVKQLGAELIGDDSVYADAEMIVMVIESLCNTGLENFQVSIGQVEFFKGLCDEAGLSDDLIYTLREYISAKNHYAVENLLIESGVSEDLRNLFLETTEGLGNLEAIRKIRNRVSNERVKKAIDNLEQLYQVLTLYGVEKYVSFDLGMLSKYHYYTGIIFKVYTYGIGDAIVKGGRYDTLLSYFGKKAPAVGFAAVVDDILEAFSRQKIQIPVPAGKEIMYYTKDTFPKILKQAQEKRKKGLLVEMRRKD